MNETERIIQNKLPKVYAMKGNKKSHRCEREREQTMHKH